ncbi:MAG: hypothetical protein PHZ09_11675 [Eubacteriales bacterium]|nr:hypothetical protein [Eubacteriales bacterium]
MKTRILCLLFCVLLLTACADNAGQEVNPETSPAAAEGEETATPEPLLPDADFEGYEFNIMGREKGAQSALWDTVDVYAEAENGDAINDAVYRRNVKLEEKYNFEIIFTPMEVANHVNLINNSVLAGDNIYDTALMHTQNCASLVLKNAILDLNTVEYLDFSQPWWDTQTIGDITVTGKTFFVMGEINITDNDATWCVMFNKMIRENHSAAVPDLYQLVRDGGWTLDRLNEYAAGVAADLDGDGKMAWDQDMWGVIHQYETANCLFLASGTKTFAKDTDGNLIYNLNSDDASGIFAVVHDFFATNADCAIITDSLTVDNMWNVVSRGTFKADRALFYIGPVANVRLIRDMETSFGILPLPKIRDTQEKHFNTMQYNNATAYTIPVTAENTARTGLILEALAIESVDTLTPAYYDITLKSKASRDEESGEMLDIIFANRIFDMSFAFNTVGTYSFLQTQVKSSTNNFASAEASNREAFISKLDDIMESIDKSD